MTTQPALDTPRAAIAERIARALRDHAQGYHVGTMSYEALCTMNRAAWREAEAADCVALVRDVLARNGWIY